MAAGRTSDKRPASFAKGFAAVGVRFSAVPKAAALAVSILTIYETAFVASGIPELAAMTSLLEGEFSVAALPVDGVEHFVRLKAGLAARWGVAPRDLKRHSIDLMIAAPALALDLVLVSNDSIFADLAAIDPRLTVEDWTA